MYKRLPGNPTPEERFFLHVSKTDFCWLWTGSTTPSGYGQFRVDGRLVPSHRWIYETVRGPIAAGLHVDHLCHVRNCVNPDHLEPVTPRENAMRSTGMGAFWAVRDFCERGHAFTPENTGTKPNGSRRCLTCHRERETARRAATMFCSQGHLLEGNTNRPRTAGGRGACLICQRARAVALSQARPKKEYCVHGHRRTPENLTSNGTCKICHARLQRERYRLESRR